MITYNVDVKLLKCLIQLANVLNKSGLQVESDLITKLARSIIPENFDNLPPIDFEEPKQKKWYLVYYWRGPKESFKSSPEKPYSEIIEIDGPFSFHDGKQKMKELEKEFVMAVSDGIQELMPKIERPNSLEVIFRLKSGDSVSAYKLINLPPEKIDATLFSHIEI